MKGTFYLLLFLFGMMLLVESCNKSTLVDSNTQDSTLNIGNTSTNGDTTIVTIGKLVITSTKTSPCYPSSEVFTFTVDNTNITDAVSFKWYFGDGFEANGTTVQHAYNNTAAYVVLLQGMNKYNKIAYSATFPVKAWGQSLRPVAIFSYKSDFTNNPNFITFNSASSVNHGSIINCFWNWGDGTTSSIANGLTRHQFPTNTSDVNYPVKLTITTDGGCTTDTTLMVWIPAAYPITGDFSAISSDACNYETFVFTPQATNVPTGSIYEWHFSDGTGDLTGNPVNYHFTYMNDYDVIMYVKLNGRTIYSAHKTVNAKGENAKPKASFYYTWVKEYSNSVLISFNSQSTVKHGTLDGFLWDFGDGNTNTDFNSFVEDRYYKTNAQTNYNIRLIVTANGCADTAYQTVSIPKK